MAARLRAGAAVLALGLVAAGCGGGRDPLEIGVKSLALDLAFKDESKADPVPPAQVIEILGLPPQEILEVDEPERVRPAPIRPTEPTFFLPPCPEAAPDAFPKEPVSVFFRGAPKPGVYGVHAAGTIRVLGSLPFALPYPSRLTYEVKNVTVTPATPPDIPNPPRDFIDQGNVVTYDLVKTISSDLVVTDSYRYTRAEFTLTKRVTKAGDRITTFTPTPAVVFESMTAGDGDTWSSAGADRESNIAMVVQGSIEKREFVDVCGQRYDAWKVNSTEQLVDIDTGEQTGTDPQQPNVYRFANHLGGLVISEEGHFTSVVEFAGQLVPVEFDYVSTFDSLEPRTK